MQLCVITMKAEHKKKAKTKPKVLYEVIDAPWIHKLLTVVQSGSI